MTDLDELEKKIQAAKHKDEPSDKALQKKAESDNSRAGMQAGIEFVTSIIAGAVIGYMLDSWLGTKPAFFLILFFLGIAAGFYNVYRVTQNLGSAVGVSQLHPSKKQDKTSAGQNTEQDEDRQKTE